MHPDLYDISSLVMFLVGEGYVLWMYCKHSKENK